LRRLRFSILISILSLTVCGVAYGSGFSIFEQGAKATAMGGAFAATADDPTAIFYNVAGIAQLRRAEVNVGGTFINFSNEFRGAFNDPYTAGTTGEYRHHTFIPPNAYVVVPVGNNITFGVGAFAGFGLRTNWDDPWVGRFISKDANVKTLSIEPAIAWQTSDGRFAIGAGAEYRRSHITLNQNIPLPIINPFTGRIADIGNAYLNSDWDSAWGYNVGVLFKPGAWRLGASYRAPMTIDYKGSATFTQISTGNAQLDALAKQGIPPNQPISTSIDFPATAVVGVATTMFPHWDIEADYTRTTWSRFKSLDIAFAQTPASNVHRPENWKDTSSYRIGANRQIGNKWAVRLGFVYDQNPQPAEGVGPLLPDSDRLGASFGVGWNHGPLRIDLTEFILHFKNRSTNVNDQGFNGSYKTDATLPAINIGYKF
jgi:long-chain fatty acid transport protein